jgi:hypothetical protein
LTVRRFPKKWHAKQIQFNPQHVLRQIFNGWL